MKVEIKAPMWEVVTMTMAALSLLLVIVNAVLVIRNQSIQFEVNQRQQTINEGLQFARIRQTLVQFLGNLAVSKNDHELADLLTRHGVAVTPTSSAPAAPQGK